MFTSEACRKEKQYVGGSFVTGAVNDISHDNSQASKPPPPLSGEQAIFLEQRNNILRFIQEVWV